jgi:predicted RNA binding protein YcfA (HicA-like mRNA interferase family)
MPPLPVLSGQQCRAALEHAGFVMVWQTGSHMVLRRGEPQPARSVAVPNHHELDRGTLRSIIRQAGFTVDEFVALLT